MLLLNADDVGALLDYPSCIRAVEEAFRQEGRGETQPPVLCGVHRPNGRLHVKAAALETSRPYFAAKTNANFPGNPTRHGLPTIQGVVLLFDAACGVPLAALDSGEVTVRRTAAATAVAAKQLARPDSRTLTVCGCGVQGRAHVEALRTVLPIARVYAYDADPDVAHAFAVDLSAELDLEITAVTELTPHALASDVCVTCTPSRDYLLDADDVSPGCFVAGVGVDDSGKRELAPALLARSRVVVDVLEQCVAMGDLHHAIAAGTLVPESVHATLGEVVAGVKAGRTAAEEIYVFDSTGTALEDIAAAVVVYEGALRVGRGIDLDLRRLSRTELQRAAPAARHPVPQPGE